MEEKEFNVINVVPFVDIMLVLLTIVLTTSTFIAQGSIPLELPKASPGKGATPKGHTIDIDGRGEIYLDGRRIPRDALKKEAATLERTAPLLIRADRKLALQSFVEVLDGVTGMGFQRVSLQTEVADDRAG